MQKKVRKLQPQHPPPMKSLGPAPVTCRKVKVDSALGERQMGVRKSSR